MSEKLLTRRRSRPWKGLLAGMVGGFAATIVMTQFQNAWQKASEALSGDQNGKESSGQESEDATMKVAGRVASIAGKELSHQTKKKAGPIVHYAFGTAMGAVYGLAEETTLRRWRKARSPIAGIAFGTALFLGADEIVIPALGLGEKPSDSPASTHVYGLISHLVYGATLQAAAGVTRKLL